MAEETTYTKADIDKAVADALEGVKSKNTELLDEVKALKAEVRKHKDIDPADLSKLEDENATLKADLAKAQADAKKATTELEKAAKQLEGETGFTSKLLIDNGLNAALAEAGVKEAPMLKAVKAMFGGMASVAVEGDQRIVKIGDKAVSDYVKEWAGTDDAKHFISAQANAGGGAPGGNGGASSKTVTRSAFDQMTQADRAKFSLEGGKVVDQAA